MLLMPKTCSTSKWDVQLVSSFQGCIQIMRKLWLKKSSKVYNLTTNKSISTKSTLLLSKSANLRSHNKKSNRYWWTYLVLCLKWRLQPCNSFPLTRWNGLQRSKQWLDHNKRTRSDHQVHQEMRKRNQRWRTTRRGRIEIRDEVFGYQHQRSSPWCQVDVRWYLCLGCYRNSLL